ncbi:MAG: cell division protein ZapA [Treponema sp.]|nr:cell division protein ZapA [Treponema sp.]
MGTLKIDILGTSFTIQASEDTEYLEKLLAYYKKITSDVNNISSVKTPLQNSILAGIMLVDELYQEKKKVTALQEGKEVSISSTNSIDEIEINQRTSDMISKIDEVL